MVKAFYEGLSESSKRVLDTYGHKKSVDINTVMNQLEISRGEARTAFKELESTQNGKMKIGRRGKPTRFLFTMDVVGAFRNMKLAQNQLSEGIAPNYDDLAEMYESVEMDEIEETLSEASINQLVNALKNYHDVKSVHLVY